MKGGHSRVEPVADEAVLRSSRCGATLSFAMRRLALFLVALLLSVVTVNSAESQLTSIPPAQPMTSIPGRGPDAIDQARRRALAPIPQAPGLQAPPSDPLVKESHREQSRRPPTSRHRQTLLLLTSY